MGGVIRSGLVVFSVGFVACASETSSQPEAAIVPAEPSAGTAGTDGGPKTEEAPRDAGGGDSATVTGLVPSGCIDDVGPGDHRFTCNGYTFDVRLPAKCKSGGCGIVLDVHGATMNAAMQDASTGMRAIGEREGYVVVQPNAKGTPPNAVWNPAADYDDVWAFLELTRTVYRVDPKRVHMTGFSQGGRMTFTFACKHADVIASAAPAAEVGCTEAEAKAAAREVPILYMHGTTDAVIGFGVAPPQRDAFVSAWSLGDPIVVASSDAYSWKRWTNAKGGVFELIQHDWQATSSLLRGHCLPGSTDPGTVPGQLFSFACKPPNAFAWGEEVMKFFQAHPMP